jgi:hypothetical protein
VSPTGPAALDWLVGEDEVGERRDRLDRVVERLVPVVPVDIVDPVEPPCVDIVPSVLDPVCGDDIVPPAPVSVCDDMPPAPGPDDIVPPPAEPVVDEPEDPVVCANTGAAIIIVAVRRMAFIISRAPKLILH